MPGSGALMLLLSSWFEVDFTSAAAGRTFPVVAVFAGTTASRTEPRGDFGGDDIGRRNPLTIYAQMRDSQGKCHLAHRRQVRGTGSKRGKQHQVSTEFPLQNGMSSSVIPASSTGSW